jgi:hypothetical protein
VWEPAGRVLPLGYLTPRGPPLPRQAALFAGSGRGTGWRRASLEGLEGLSLLLWAWYQTARRADKGPSERSAEGATFEAKGR